EQRDIGEALTSGQLVPVASGRGHDGAVAIHQHDAVLWAARLDGGAPVTLPDAPHVHVFVARGDAVLDGDGDGGVALTAGDAARLSDAGALHIGGGPSATELLGW